MFVLARTVKFKAPGHSFYRRLRGVQFLDTVTIRGVACYECFKGNGASTYFPVAGTSVMVGRKVHVLFREPATTDA